MATGYCNVCEKKVVVQDNRFVEHTDRHNRICYGSFTPSYDINPFNMPKRKRRLSEMLDDPYLGIQIQPVDLAAPVYPDPQMEAEDQFLAELAQMDGNPGIANGT